MRRGVALLTGLALLAGCSSGTPEGAADAARSGPSGDGSGTAPGFPFPEGAWLIALEFEAERRGPLEDSQRVYLSYQPQTGQATYRVIPPEDDDRGSSPDSRGAGRDGRDAELQVSADYQLAVRARGTSRSERKAGIVPIYDLGTGGEQKLDLRKITRNFRMEPVRVAFDPTQPRTLHVLDADKRIWTVDLTSQQAVAAGNATSESAYFDTGTGRIVDSDNSGDRRLPGGTALRSSRGYPELPGKSTPDYVRTEDGTVWAFTLEGSGDDLTAWRLRAYRFVPGAADWERLPGEPAPSLAAGIPDAGMREIEIDWVRPPRP